MNINYFNQPTTSVSHGLTLFVTVPIQNEQSLQHLKSLELNIGLVLYREAEPTVLSTPIAIPYQTTEGKFAPICENHATRYIQTNGRSQK